MPLEEMLVMILKNPATRFESVNFKNVGMGLFLGVKGIGI